MDYLLIPAAIVWLLAAAGVCVLIRTARGFWSFWFEAFMDAVFEISFRDPPLAESMLRQHHPLTIRQAFFYNGEAAAQEREQRWEQRLSELEALSRQGNGATDGSE